MFGRSLDFGATGFGAVPSTPASFLPVPYNSYSQPLAGYQQSISMDMKGAEAHSRAPVAGSCLLLGRCGRTSTMMGNARQRSPQPSVNRVVRVVHGKGRGSQGMVIRSGHGFYCVHILPSGEALMKRGNQLQVVDPSGSACKGDPGLVPIAMHASPLQGVSLPSALCSEPNPRPPPLKVDCDSPPAQMSPACVEDLDLETRQAAETLLGITCAASAGHAR